MEASGHGGMQGEIAEGVLPELLRELYVGRRSGTLTLVRGAERQSLRFGGGHIVNAHTNVVEERLGEMLVRRGLLTGEGLARATAVVVRDKRRLGEVLAELGLMDQVGLEDAIAFHVHEMLAKVFAWQEGTYSFEDQTGAGPGQEVTLKLSTGELILEAVRAVHDPDVVRYALGDIDRVLALSSDPLLRFQTLTLSPTDGFVLSRVDGVASAREIIQMIPLPAEETQKSLFGLLSTGTIEYAVGHRRKRDAAAPAGTAAADHARPPAPPPQPPPAPAAPHPPAPPAPPTPPAVAAASAPRTPAAQAAAEAPRTAEVASASAPPGPVDDKAAERRREILEAWEGLKTRNHFEVLGLARAVGETEVKEAYFRLAKRFHPDVHHGASLGDLRDNLEAVFIRLGEAYDVLKDPRRRADYEERLGRYKPRAAEPGPAAASAQAPPPQPEPPVDPEEEARQAEDAVRRAAKLLEQAKVLEQEKPGEPEHQRLTYDAIQLLEPVLEKLQGKPRLRAQLLLARANAKNPKWAKRAEELLLDASRENPQSPEPWALLGAIYAERGLRTRAVSMYRKVLELNPEHEEAGHFLAGNAPPEPGPPEAEGGGGLLGRLFRKG